MQIENFCEGSNDFPHLKNATSVKHIMNQYAEK